LNEKEKWLKVLREKARFRTASNTSESRPRAHRLTEKPDLEKQAQAMAEASAKVAEQVEKVARKKKDQSEYLQLTKSIIVEDVTEPPLEVRILILKFFSFYEINLFFDVFFFFFLLFLHQSCMLQGRQFSQFTAMEMH
jgi:hypothetical protein